MRKAIILTALIISITGFTAAQDADVTIEESPTAAWGGDGVDFDIHCEGSDCAATAADRYAEVCGAEWGAASASGTDGDVTYHFENVKPQVSNEDIPCTIGDKYDITFIDKGFGWEHTLENVYSVKGNSMNSHVGQNIIVNYDIDNSELRNFMLTDDVWNTNPSPSEEPVIMLQEYDTFSDRGYVSLALADGETADEPILKSGMSITDFVHLDSVKEVESEYDANALDDNTASDVEDIVLPKVNNWVYGDVEGEWGIGSQSPIHEGGDYNLGGDIALGYYPEYYDSSGNKIQKSGEGPYFFVCRSGAVMKNGHGKQVPQVVDFNNPNQEDSADLYKCDSDGWTETAKCDDGLDNDGDTVIDLNDPECNGDSTRNTESFQCDEPRIGKLDSEYSKDGTTYSKGTKVAFYNNGGSKDYTDSVSSCSYSTFDVSLEYQDQPPELFRCNLDGSISKYGSTDSEDEGNAVASNNAESFCTELSNSVLSTVDVRSAHSSGMPAVEYFVPKKVVPVGSNKFATDTGFKNKFYTALLDAESEYATASSVHDKDTWNQLGMTDLGDGYNDAGDSDGAYGTDYSDYMDSWTIANASVSNDKVISRSGTVDDKDVFPGGFAGRCTSGQQWRFIRDTGWTCSGIIPWTQTVIFPDYRSEEDSQTVGFYILPHNFQTATFVPDREYSFKAAFEEAKDKDVSLESVSAICWIGEPEDQPSSFDSSDDGTVWFDKEVKGLDSRPEKPVPVFGKLDLSSASQYTCKWGYETTDGEFRDSIGGKPKFIELSTNSILRDEWFGEGFDRDQIGGEFDSGAVLEQFQSWNDENSDTSQDETVEESKRDKLLD